MGRGHVNTGIQYNAVEVTEILSVELIRFRILTDAIYYASDALSRKFLHVNISILSVKDVTRHIARGFASMLRKVSDVIYKAWGSDVFRNLYACWHVVVKVVLSTIQVKLTSSLEA